jgi:hypothetical protein
VNPANIDPLNLDFEPIKANLPGRCGPTPRLYRALVPGGWLVCQETWDKHNPTSTAFVPDPDHEWGQAEREAREKAETERKAAEAKRKAEQETKLREHALHIFVSVADSLRTHADELEAAAGDVAEATLTELLDTAQGAIDGLRTVDADLRTVTRGGLGDRS